MFARCCAFNIPSCENTTGGTQRDDVCRGYGAHRGPGGVVGRPREETGTTGESTDGDEKDAAVSDVGVRGPSHDGEAGNGGESEYSEVDAATVGFVRHEGDADGDETGADVWRDSVELCFGSGPTQISE